MGRVVLLPFPQDVLASAGGAGRRGGPTMTIEEFLPRVARVKRSGKGWTARCPAHEDRQASLSVTEGDDKRVLVHCFAGCSTEDVVGALGLTMSDLFPRGGGGRSYPRATPATVQQSPSRPGCTLVEDVPVRSSQSAPCREEERRGSLSFARATLQVSRV